MTHDWTHLGTLLRADREARMLTQEALGERIGVGRARIAAIEGGDVKRITQTVRAYAREVGWEDGSMEEVLRGGEPTRRSGDNATNSPSESAGIDIERLLPLRLVQELEDGQVVDTDMIDLTPDGSLAVMMLVVDRGGDQASPERISADLREWSRKQRAIRRIAAEEGPEGG